MPSLFKWFLFVALTGGYIWMVFFGFSKTDELAAIQPASLEDIPEPPQTEDDILDSTALDSSFSDPLQDDVEWEAEPDEPEDVQVADHYEEFGETENYLLIYGSYLSEERAQAAIGYLEFDCPECEVVFIETYYKLVLERSATKEEARALQKHYKELGASGFVQKL